MALGQLLILEINTFKYLKENVVSRYFLILLICLNLLLVHEIIVHSRYILYMPHFTFTGEAITLLIWPLIFLIAKKILNKKKSFCDFFHFLPFIVYTNYRINDYLLPSLDKLELLKLFYNNIDSQLLVARTFVVTDFIKDFFLFRMQPLIYIVIILIQLYPNIRSARSEANKNSIRWLRILIYGFLIIWLLKYLLFLMGYFYAPFSISHPVLILLISAQVFLTSQFALTNKIGIPKVFEFSKGISEKELEDIAIKAKAFIKDNEAYLDTNLSLTSLAKMINTNSNYLSKGINYYYNKNFTDFINEFRVATAKSLITSSKMDFYTLEGIAKESGFNSISTFNRAFLKVEGTTPSQYKKSFNS
jgi:AraC-like DNA-binding protein